LMKAAVVLFITMISRVVLVAFFLSFFLSFVFEGSWHHWVVDVVVSVVPFCCEVLRCVTWDYGWGSILVS
jgi:hypothetical protein